MKPDGTSNPAAANTARLAPLPPTACLSEPRGSVNQITVGVPVVSSSAMVTPC